MKRFVLLSSGVICLAVAAALFNVSSASAVDFPWHGLIGMFKDATHVYQPDNEAANTVCPPEAYEQFQCWIWCMPSSNGLHAAEFAVYSPPTIITLSSVKNPLITVELGSLAGGISVAFDEGMCQMDWVWLYQLTLMNLAPITPWYCYPGFSYPPLPPSPPAMYVAIIPHPGTLPYPAYQFADYLPGYPIEPFFFITPLWICYDPPPGPISVRETNWGAIKSLF